MGRGDWGKAAAVGLGLLLLMSCSQEKPKADSCLINVDSNALPQALERCNRVVAAHPKDAKPLNDRFILYTLLQNKAAACKDIRKAATAEAGMLDATGGSAKCAFWRGYVAMGCNGAAAPLVDAPRASIAGLHHQD